jgi:hypothetical protein
VLTLLTALTWAGLRSDAGGAPATASSLENSRLRAAVSATGALALTDKTAGVTWASDRPGWVTVTGGDGRQTLSLATSEVTVTGGEDQLLLTFAGLSGDEVSDESFRMQVRLALAPSHLDLEIASVESARPLQAVEYPAHLLTVPTGIDEGYVVVPNTQGLLFPSRYDAGFMRYGQSVWRAIADIEKWWSFESGMLNMPWFGARRGGSSILAWVPTPADAMLHVIGNAVVGNGGRVVDARNARNPGARLSSLTPVWRASKGELAYPRRLRLEPVADGYVGMAKRYREYARETGRLVTLREKIAQNPEHARIVGAPDIKIYVYTNRLDEPYLRAWSEPVLDGYARLHTTFDQVTQMVRDLGEMGVDKALVILAGWNHAGYVVAYWQHGTPFGREDHANHVLHDLLTAQPSSWSLVHDQWEDLKPLIQQTSELLGPLHTRTAHAVMVDHTILTDDHMVQRSEFADGTRVWVNYGIRSFRDRDGRIAPKGFRVRVPGQKEKVGVAGREIIDFGPESSSGR